ncbi:Rhs element Vgr protein [Pseudomonas amygdali pv. eriobotryae]|uniref:Rhs element Vgr protein n=2 Tax=Pseudomonas amygdali TaxID=47877 RepID=A0A0P9QYI6_PSEA0|nr:contractile injection system protein, VgrG/Pvc8 family [Pseudomonas amygdali]KPX30188.1 Rhs element Vgr protein [Pseudomonas amygdali pv. eriobotryae]KWS79044.1 type IV secretion protein Rhs [Pseudomonas amygdali pv. eriobotryae]RMM03469.1 Rhs element Vgr protein [Pseudomonas amygdali pv. eriobotryae]GFZ60425.1 hypothetical protein PSE10A_29360 [Pseudomonas amygdali pv. eriobotryae]GFZ73468.1 hypothetical protein PSE10C_42100 [Pseudomonas amygdali pv. eriobotryae]
MPDPTSAPLFRLEIARLQRCFTVISFSASEAISQPFTFELDILGDGLDLDLTGLMYKPASLSFGSRKNFHGQIQGATRKHYQPGPACYTLIMGPRLACLGLRHQSRIFQHMTATRIITHVLEEHGLKNCFRFDLPTECRERDCCVQYQESDLQLVQRLCAEEGIHYHFVHSRRRHELVFGANLHGFARSPVARWRQFAQQSGVTRFAVTEHATQLPGSRAGQHATGESTLPFVTCAELLPLADHPEKNWNHMWLITEVRHRFGLVDGNDHGASDRYSNQFKAIPWEVGFRTPAPAPRPPIAPLQRGWIIGINGEPARLDAAGRVRVRLEWEWQHPNDPGTGCWLHLAPGLDIECRAGMSVAVSFSEDDTHPPLIIGCLPAQEARRENDPAPVDNVQMHLDRQMFIGPDRLLRLADGVCLYLGEGSKVTLDAGSSTVQIDDDGLTLSSPRISFASKANGRSSGDPDAIE